jgi:hypothetical protein
MFLIFLPPCEAGYSIFTVALLVLEGNEKGIHCPGYKWTTMSLGDVNAETWSFLRVGRKADDLDL